MKRLCFLPFYVILLACIAHGATFSVTNTSDSGAGSLREAIDDSNSTAGYDTVSFSLGVGDHTITLTTGELEITDDMLLQEESGCVLA